MGKKPFPICACPCGADPCVTDGTWYLTLQNWVHSGINSHANAARATGATGTGTANYWYWWESTLYSELNSIVDLPFNLEFFPSLDGINRNPDPDNTYDFDMGGILPNGHYVLLDLGIADFSDTLYWATGSSTKPSSFLFTPETVTYSNIAALVGIAMEGGTDTDRTPQVRIVAEVTSSIGTVRKWSDNGIGRFPYCIPSDVYTYIRGEVGSEVIECGLPLNCNSSEAFIPGTLGWVQRLGFVITGNPYIAPPTVPGSYPAAFLDKTP